MIKTKVYNEEDYCYFIVSKKGKDYKYLISKEDKEKVEKKCWSLASGKSKGTNEIYLYAVTYVGTGRNNNKYARLHRFILDLKNPEIIVDHINRNVFDNRRENLRLADKRINAINSKMRCDNKSGVRGVFWREDRKKWTARIKVREKYLSLGTFSEKDEAIKARKEAEEKYFKGIKYEN